MDHLKTNQGKFSNFMVALRNLEQEHFSMENIGTISKTNLLLLTCYLLLRKSSRSRCSYPLQSFQKSNPVSG